MPRQIVMYPCRDDFGDVSDDDDDKWRCTIYFFIMPVSICFLDAASFSGRINFNISLPKPMTPSPWLPRKSAQRALQL